MIRYFLTHGFIQVLDGIRSIEYLAWDKNSKGEGATPVPREELEGRVKSWITGCQVYCQDMEIKPALDRINNQFLPALKQGMSYSQLQHEAKTIRDTIDNELSDRRFVYISKAKAAILDAGADTWKPVWDWCPEAESDIKEAVEAYVLGLNTACVFQAMRVSERGLRGLAKALHVRIVDKKKQCPLEYGTWEKVIQAIGNKINTVRNQPQGPKRQEKLTFYSDAADHCTYMKDIWRNEISHARRSYNDAEALGALNRVKDFMYFLVRNVQIAGTPAITRRSHGKGGIFQHSP